MARNNLDHVDFSPPPFTPNNLEYKEHAWEGSVARRPEEMLVLENGNESIHSFMSP